MGFRYHIDCPICQNERKDCREADTGIIFCLSGNAAPSGWGFIGTDKNNLFGIYAPNQESKEAPTPRTAKATQKFSPLSAQERDANYRKLAQAGLSAKHRQYLRENRGLTDDQIHQALSHGLLWSWNSDFDISADLPGATLYGKPRKFDGNLAIAVPDANGQIIGVQLHPLQPGQYFWASSAKIDGYGPGLKTGKLPMACHFNGQDKDLYLCDSVAFKPLLASWQHQINIMGAAGANFDIEQIQAAIKGQGFDRIILVPDAGDAINRHVRPHTIENFDRLQSLGLPVLVAWWGQIEKSAGDIDEIEFSQITFLDQLPEVFFPETGKPIAICTNQHLRAELDRLGFQVEVTSVWSAIPRIDPDNSKNKDRRLASQIAAVAKDHEFLLCPAWRSDPEQQRLEIFGYRQLAGLLAAAGAKIEMLMPQPIEAHRVIRGNDWVPFSDYVRDRYQPAEWFKGAIAECEYRNYKSLTAPVTAAYEFSRRYCTEDTGAILAVMNGVANILIALTGHGKTVFMQRSGQQCQSTITISPLVALAEQTAADLGMKGRFTTGDYWDNQAANHEGLKLQGETIVINYLWKLYRRVPTLENVQLNLDEFAKLMDLLARGTNMGGKHYECIQAFRQLCRSVIAGGGRIVGGQNTVHQHHLDFFTKITGIATRVIRNNHVHRRQSVTIHRVTGASAAIEHVVERTDEKTLLFSTSQAALERADEVCLARCDRKIIRIDTKTKHQYKGVLASSEKRQQFLNQATEQVGFTPVLGMGANLDAKQAGHDQAILMATAPVGLEGVVQLPDRDRSNLPLEILVPQVLQFGGYKTCWPTDLIFGQTQRHQDIVETLDLHQYLNQIQELDQGALDVLDQSLSNKGIAHACAVEVAHQTAIENYENAHLHRVLTEYYTDKAVQLHHSELPPVSKDFKDELRAAQDVIHVRETLLFVQAQTLRIQSVEQALQIRGSGEATYPQRVTAQKYLLQKEYPEAPWNDHGFVRTAWIEGRGQYLEQCTLYWSVLNLEKQKQLDQRRLLKQARSGMIGLGSVSHQYKKAALLKSLGVLVILQMEGYSNSTPEVQAFWTAAQDQADAIRLYLGFVVSPAKSPVRLLNEILRSISFVVRKVRHQGGRGCQERIYEVINGDCVARSEILAALDRAYALVCTKSESIQTELDLVNTPVVGQVYTRRSWGDQVKVLAIEAGRALVKFIAGVNYLDSWVEIADLAVG